LRGQGVVEPLGQLVLSRTSEAAWKTTQMVKLKAPVMKHRRIGVRTYVIERLGISRNTSDHAILRDACGAQAAAAFADGQRDAVACSARRIVAGRAGDVLIAGQNGIEEQAPAELVKLRLRRSAP